MNKAKEDLGQSFRHAFAGLRQAITTQRNLRIHLAAAVVVTLLGLWVGLKPWEFAILILLYGLVIGMELMNTVVEVVVDMLSPSFSPLAKRAKDLSAGAVLVTAIVAVLVGLLLFGPHLIDMVRGPM